MKISEFRDNDEFLSTDYVEPFEVLLRPNMLTCVHTGKVQGRVQFPANSGTNDTSANKKSQYIIMELFLLNDFIKYIFVL